MRKIKVMHLITGLNVGGAEKVVYDLSLELNRRGHNNLVVGISDKDFLAKMFRESGINVQILGVNKKINSFVKGLFSLVSLIKKNEINIIHAHMTHALIMAVCIKFFMPGLKIVFTSHNFNVGSKKREKVISILKPFRNIDIIFSKKMWKGMYKKNAVVIPNGINTALYKMNIEKNKVFTYLAIGRIEAVKNHKFLAEAAVKLRAEIDFEIHIVGDGILKEELLAYIQDNNLENIFKILGYRKDINTICNQSHVFVLPSLWEGLPISLLEAGASSLPVIVTPVGSISELVDDNSGYLKELDAFMDAMRHTYFNYTDVIEKGKVLQAKIEANYDLNRIVDRHIEIYENI